MEIEPIRIHHADSDEEVRARHARIERSLEAVGKETVQATLGHGFPTQWNPIISAWLRGDRLKTEKV